MGLSPVLLISVWPRGRRGCFPYPLNMQFLHRGLCKSTEITWGVQLRDPRPQPRRFLCVRKPRRRPETAFPGQPPPLPQPLSSSSPHPYPDPPGGEGVPRPSRPSPRTPGRPTRPEAPRCRPGVPADLVPAPWPGQLAYSQQPDGICGRGSAGQSPASAWYRQLAPRSALHHPPAVPFPSSTLMLQA